MSELLLIFSCLNAYTTMGIKVELANVSGRKCNSAEIL